MRIVKIVEELGVGGLPNYVIQVARGLQDRGHEVLIAHGNPDPGDHLETEGLHLVHLDNLARVKGLNPDLVHVHLLSDTGVLRGLFDLDVPLVRFFHDYTSTCLRRGKRRWSGDRCQRALGASCAAFGCMIGRPAPGSVFPRLMNLPDKILERDLYREFDASIVGSSHMVRMLETNGFPSARIHKIPYFSKFADGALTPVDRSGPLPGRDRPFELLFTGQAVIGKGLEVLIESLRDLPGNWRLTVCSDGPRLPNAKKMAQEYGIIDRMEFHTWMPQSALLDYYRKSDIFVLPSIWDDPGPLVGIEALSFGAPIVGFAVGGIPDYLIDGQTGVLVRDVSAAGLRAGLIRAMDSPEKIAEMAIAAQKLVVDRHSLKDHISGVEEVYRQVDRRMGQERNRA
ncbi:MAG: glycosyltransferase family 4 protein [Rhodospirillales bacterium]|nr:glycosyltransferase family 4 protein [Rhodospirillales bacterium]